MGGPVAVQASTEVGNKPSDLVDVDEENGGGGISPDLARAPSMASPRLIPVPDSPPLSAQLPPNPEVLSSPSNRNCAPSHALGAGTTNHDQSSYGQFYELRKQRGYYKQDTKAALRTRLAAMDAARKIPADGGSNDTDASTTVSGKKTGPMEDTMDTSMALAGYTE